MFAYTLIILISYKDKQDIGKLVFYGNPQDNNPS